MRRIALGAAFSLLLAAPVLGQGVRGDLRVDYGYIEYQTVRRVSVPEDQVPGSGNRRVLPDVRELLAERVADEAVDELFAFLDGDGVVDRWMADQLLLPLALAAGESVFRTAEVSTHLLTNAAVIRAFLPVRIAVDGALGQAALVRVQPGPAA